MGHRVLVVDDVPRNVKLLADLLSARGYDVLTASSGSDALSSVRHDRPDLVLLDVMMPGIDGYEVCRVIRSEPSTQLLPVIMVTALDSTERVQGLEAGADDFITKPIHQPELLARVHSLLRIKDLHDEVRAQQEELAQWNHTLEQRVQAQVEEVERLSRLKRFFSPQVAELILKGGADDPLKTHRSEITVVFIDLRNYTVFSEAARPDEVMGLLHDYHAAMGRLIMRYQGTVERFAGDMIMIFFNDPIPCARPEEQAVRMALDMHAAFVKLAEPWIERSYALGIGIGIAKGIATLGAIGFEGRRDYGAIGTVCSLAARLCGQAHSGQILITQDVLNGVRDVVAFESIGELALKGFRNPTTTFNVSAWTGSH